MTDVGDLSPLDRRRRAAYSVLGLGLLGTLLVLMTRYGVSDVGVVLDLSVWMIPPLLLAAGVNRLAQRSWDAVSWLLGTWALMVGVTFVFLFYHVVLHPDYDMFNAMVFIVPALAQFAVVGTAALVAFVLHRRELGRSTS